MKKLFEFEVKKTSSGNYVALMLYVGYDGEKRTIINIEKEEHFKSKKQAEKKLEEWKDQFWTK